MRLFKWKIFGVIPAPLLGLLVIFSILTPLIINSRNVEAAASTISQETDGLNIFRGIKYYHAFETCAASGSFKKEIRGDDVTKGPRYWTRDNSTITIGVAIDQWNDKNGSTTCAGDGDDQVWMEDAYKLFGVDPKGGEASLKKLGYSCSVDNGTTVCKKDDINNTILDFIKNSPYLKSSSIGDTSSTLYKIGTYAGALKTLQTACAGKPGGNTNIVSVSIVQSNGSVKQENWTQNKSTPLSGISPINSMKSNSDSCNSAIVSAINDNADAYGVWVNESTCRTNYPELANEISRLTWCARGRANITNATYCITEPTNVVTRNACFIGAGHPQDSNGKTAGELCMAMRFPNNQETAACIGGALNKSTSTYCATTYPALDSLNASGNLPADINKARRDACLLGAQLDVSGGGPVDNVNTGITPDDGDPDTTTCVIDSVGWIVCPIVGFASTMSDVLYGWISSYMQVQPLNVNIASDDNTMYVAWNIMRNIANVAFVIAFVIIIYSQMTGMGVNNYGVKKALPRLIIAAILVNLSYWIAAAAVDISNIVGNNLYNVLKNLPLGNVSGESLGWEALAAWLLAGATATGVVIAGASLVAGPATWAGVGMVALYVLIPIVIAVVLALILAFVVLALRQALIIVMIVVAPLAFVAMLLPNTEKFFKMWQKSLTTLLVFYPLFSLLFGGAYVAGMIIIGSAGQGESSPVAMTIIIGMAVTTLPLFLTPMLIKFSSGIMGQTASLLNSKFKGNPLSRAMKGLRNRKAGLMMGENLGRNGSRNPFNRAYRAIQNNRQADEKRKDIISSSNKASYLETARSGRLDAQGKALGERIKTAEAHHEEAHERNVLTNPDLMRLRRAQDASKRATANYSAQQTENIERNLSPESLAHDQVRANAELRTKGLQEDQKLAIERAQQADPELRGERLRQAATAKELTQLEKDRQRIVSQAGNAEGAAALAAQGYDPGVISRIQDANNATADTDLHIAHNEAENTAAIDTRQGADANLTRVKLATEAAKQVSTNEAKHFEDVIGDTKTAEGRASLEAQGLISTATATSFANTQRSIADSEVFIARSNAEAGAQIAQAQQGDMDIQNAKLATEAAQQSKATVDKSFEEVVANAKTIAGGQELVDQGYDANIVDGLQDSKNSIADSEARTAFANSESGLETTLRQNSDAEMRDVKLNTVASQRDQKAEDAKFEQVVTEATSEAGGTALQARGYSADAIGRLQDSQVDTAVAAAATSAAQRVQQNEFTTSVRNNETLPDGTRITEAMAGIDESHGQALATAQAIETQRKARESNVSAFSIMHRDAGIGTSSLSAMSQSPNYTPEEREAAGRAVIDSGNIDEIKPYIQYLSTALSNPLISNEERGAIQDLQKAAGERIASSPGKPIGIGPGEIEALRNGTYSTPTVAAAKNGPLTQMQTQMLTSADLVQTYNVVTEKGVSAEGWASMDKNDIGTITQLATRDASGQTIIPAQRVESLKASIETALTDPRISVRIKERETELLKNLFVDQLGGDPKDLLPKKKK